MILSLISRNITARVAILLSSVLCAGICYAQNDLGSKLTHALETQDWDEGVALYRGIEEKSIASLPDSVLFDYHYLGGYINSELPDHAKAIKHLLEAKRLCDTSLGTYSIGYMEIMRGLGMEYVEVEDYDSALATYQEAITKSMAIREFAPQAFGSLIMGVAECYEFKGWFSELTAHLRDAWQYWNKDAKPFSYYNYYPLWTLQEMYRRYEMFEKALEVSDYIIEFIEGKVGKNDYALVGELYFRGNILQSMKRIDDSITTYERALNILGKSKDDPDDYKTSILGNRLLAIIESSKWEDYKDCLKDMKKHGVEKKDDKFYFNALYSAAGKFNEFRKYEVAQEISDELVRIPMSREEEDVVTKQAQTIKYNIEAVSNLAKLESDVNEFSFGSKEWFDTSHNLSSAYYLLGETSKNLEVLKNMHTAIGQNPTNGSDFYFWVLGNLYGLCLESEDFSNALIYAEEKLAYLKTLGNVPDDIWFYAYNNVLVAMMKANQLSGIDTVLKEVGKYCELVFQPVSESYATYLHNAGRANQLQGKYAESKDYYLKAMRMQKKTTGNIYAGTVKYLNELERQMEDEELDL